MEYLAAVAVTIYVLVGAGAAVWSHLRGNHRPGSSRTARVVSSIVAGLLWPGMALDVWLMDPDDTRRQRRNRKRTNR